MKIHEVKIYESYADAVLSGEKTFEIRNNDRGYQKGDRLKFKVVEDGHPMFTALSHDLNEKDYEITYVHSGLGMQEGYVALAIKAVEDGEGMRWIPCDERLPEDRRTVLVTAYWHETYQVMEASYYGDGLWWCVPFNNCGEHMQRLKPIAWMPLPESYKGRKNDSN